MDKFNLGLRSASESTLGLKLGSEGCLVEKRLLLIELGWAKNSRLACVQLQLSPSFQSVFYQESRRGFYQELGRCCLLILDKSTDRFQPFSITTGCQRFLLLEISRQPTYPASRSCLRGKHIHKQGLRLHKN